MKLDLLNRFFATTSRYVRVKSLFENKLIVLAVPAEMEMFVTNFLFSSLVFQKYIGIHS